MAWSDEMEDLADAVLAEFGAGSTVTITSSVPGVMNNTTGLRAATTASVTATVVRYERTQDLEGQGKSSFEQSMIAVKVADVSFTVDSRCKVTIGSAVWSVTKANRVLDGTLYELELQRAVSAK